MQWKRDDFEYVCVCIIPEYGLNIQMHVLLKTLQYTNFSIKCSHSKKVQQK